MTANEREYISTRSTSYSLLGVALFTALTSVGGYLRIPVPPVPFTLQTLFVYLSADILGSRRGSQSQLIFLVLGLMGVPVFALGGGPGYVLQPTFGYLLAFPIAAWAIGRILDRQHQAIRWRAFFTANAVGFLIIFTAGVAYLYINVNVIVHKSISWTTAFWSGAVIFLPGEGIKMAVAAVLAKKIRPWM
jgi:biotin transport system substrate-specific component